MLQKKKFVKKTVFYWLSDISLNFTIFFFCIYLYVYFILPLTQFKCATEILPWVQAWHRIFTISSSVVWDEKKGWKTLRQKHFFHNVWKQNGRLKLTRYFRNLTFFLFLKLSFRWGIIGEKKRLKLQSSFFLSTSFQNCH